MTSGTSSGPDSCVLHRALNIDIPIVDRGEGHFLVLADGRRVFDGSCGAAVSCIGHNDQRVIDAIVKQVNKVSYCSTSFFSTTPVEDLCRFLVDSTDGALQRAYIVNSGKDLSLRRQYLVLTTD